MDRWKQDFADEAEKAIDEKIVKEVIDEYVLNMKSNYGVDLSKGLPRLGLMKVAMATALAARAHAVGLDPERLRLSDKEATEEMIELARSAHRAGTPVFVVSIDDP